MTTSHHVELDAAKLLQKLIQDSKDEPAKLATKLFVICQHMKLSGKEHSLPYQVISRAMEKVINQHGLDMNVLSSSRLPLTSGPQEVDAGHGTKGKDALDNQLPTSRSDLSHGGISSGAWHGASSSQTKEEAYNGPFQNFGVLQPSKVGPGGLDMARHELIYPSKPLVGLGRVDSMPVDAHQGSFSHRSGKSSEQESPASVPMDDTRSANSQEIHDSIKSDNKANKKNIKKSGNKRKRADSKAASDAHSENPQQSDNISTGSNSRKGKQVSKGGLQGQLSGKYDDHAQVNPVQHAVGAASLIRAKQESGHSFSERIMDDVKTSNPFLVSPKNHDDGEVSSVQSAGLQKGKMLPRSNILGSAPVWSQNRFASSQVSQGSNVGIMEPSSDMNNASPYHVNEVKGLTLGSNDSSKLMSLPSNLAHASGKVFGTASAFSSFAMAKMGFPFPAHQSSSPFENQYTTSKLQNENYLGSYSGSQLLEKGGDANSINVSAGSPGSAKPTSDGIPHIPQKFSEAPTNSSLHASEASAGIAASGKSLLQEKRGGLQIGASSYTNPMVSGVQDRHYLDYVSLERNRDAFSKLKTGSNAYAEPFSNVQTIASRNATSTSTNTPFNDQQLRQLRAQCLVFLAFRNNLLPRKLHLEIALGVNNTQEGGGAEGAPRVLNDCRGTDTSARESVDNHERSGMFGRANDITKGSTTSSGGNIMDRDSSLNAMESVKMNRKNIDMPIAYEENKHFSAFKQRMDNEARASEMAESYIASNKQQSDSFGHSGRSIHDSHLGRGATELSNLQGVHTNQVPSVVCVDKPPGVEKTDMLRTKNSLEFFKESIVSMVHRDSTLEETENCSGHSQIMNDSDYTSRSHRPGSPLLEATKSSDWHLSLPSREFMMPSVAKNSDNSKHAINPSKDVNMFFPHEVLNNRIQTTTEFAASYHPDDTAEGSDGMDNQRVSVNQKLDIHGQSTSDGLKIFTNDDILKYSNTASVEYDEEEEGYESLSNDVPTSPPKYTTFDKWMTDYQKRKLAEEQKWFLKQKQADERITTCFAKLKENVNSSEDISAKTKSVIELKKLQLLKLQRRLRSEFLDDFFKPIASDMDRLKSIKKHRHGRRVKQLEKFEQKMKEERLKRIRERQKEFFAEIEAHREKLEDYFKVKRERWKGFNKYVKEFHKRKERIYREKIDRIQREKINLLKNNDVEGYLRMVQDAKSDRVRQLLKETEKYLQKLGSRLKEAKGMSRRFEMEVEDCRPADVDEKEIAAIDNEDESDQAQHYLESNEKYYMLAHSIKESINEQPSSLVGGKLREYQMNGLRWLVSLYNNHLNGILADEMGLGKTVQVIALICYLMEKKNDRGPFLVVVPSSVLPGWASEICNWAPSINAISYSGSPEERRKLYKERIVHRKFNVLLTTYEYLMNKHDKPKLSKVQWHYIIIDEGHRIKNASCKLNADLKHYSSTHRLLLTGTPLQNNLDELWALLNFLLPNIFNSSEDFSQWFNKPFEGNVDASPDEALLTEEENLLIINRLHQVLRPFVLRRLKHKVENELPEKIERLIRCEASAYQKLLMKRVEENLGSIGNAKGRSVHNTVMEMRNICNHPYLSQINSEEIDALLPKHYLPPVVRLCGKMEMLDRLLPKLKATDHRVLFFSTMTRLLDVMEEYLSWKRYKYLRLDGHTSGNDRGALIDEFNRPGSETFIFLLSIRAGGVGVNLQAADTVIIFDTDWNPQVDLQAQARAHRIGQKRDVLVLRFETVRTVEEHVRASAEHKLGVANQSITAGFFDNNTSAEDRREYLESLLRECKKEEAALVLDDDSLNDLLARSESEIDVFESIDKKRREEEMAAWINLVQGNKIDASKPLSMPSRLVTEDDLKPFYEAMRIYDTSIVNNVPIITKRKGQNLGGLDTEQYGRGKRAREIRSYEDQMTEEEFEKMCQVDSPESAAPADQSQGLYMAKIYNPPNLIDVVLASPQAKDSSTQPNESLQPSKEPQVKRGRGRPRRSSLHMTTSVSVPPAPFPITNKGEMEPHKEPSAVSAGSGPQSAAVNNVIANTTPQLGVTALHFYPSPSCSPIPKARGRPSNGGETSRGRGRKQKYFLSAVGAQLNAYTVIQAGVDATMSKPDANVVAEGNATMNVAVGVPNFASIDYKTGQIPGSSTVVDAPAFKASSSRLPEILDNTMSVIVEKDIGDVTTVSETESASIGTKLPVTPDQVSVLQPKNPDGVKTDSDYSTAKQTFGSSTPDAFSPKQGQAEKTVDSLQERTQKTEQNIESSLNDKHTEVGINDVNSIQMLDKTPPDLHAKSSEMLKPADENRSDICTQMNQETTPSVDVEAFNKLKSVDKSLLRNSKSTSGNSLLASHSSSVGDKAPGDESQSSVSIEAIKFQDNASITGTPMLSSTSMNHENLADPIPSCQVQDSPVLDYRADRVVIHRDSENRASVTRKKAAARETRSRCNSSTAACERRARQAGLKLADGSKKAESRGRTGKATTMKTKQESGNIEAGPGTSRFKTAQGPGISFQQIETSLEKLDPTKQGNRQIMSSEKAVTSASRNFEQTVTKEIKLDQGVTGVSAFDPNKTLSVTSKGNVETNTTSSSNMEGGLVLGLPSLREFPLPKINPLEGKSNMVLPANATIKLTDNFKNTEIDQLLEEPVTSSVTCIRPEGFSEAEVKQLTSVSKSSAPDRNTVPEILEAKITGRSLVKSDAQNSKTHPADLNPTNQEKSGSQSCTKEDCSVTSVLEVDKPVVELESSHLEKRVIDDSNADNLKSQSVIIPPSSCSVTCDENEGKVSVSVENEKDNSSTSSDLVKVMSLENNPEISQKHPPSTALPDSSLIGSKKFAVQEHNASTIMLTISSELIEHEAQQEAVAASPVFGANESIDPALEEQHLSAISQTDLKLSELVEHAAREQDSSTNVQQVLGASASVEHTTDNATDSLNGLGFTESVGHATEKIKASVAYKPLSGVCVSMELHSDDHTSAFSISGSDNGHGLTNALPLLDVSKSIEHSPAEHSTTAVCCSVGHEPPEIENRMLTDNDGDNGSRGLSSACTLSNIPKESIDDMECAPGQSLDALPPEATHVHDKNIQFNQQVDIHVENCHEENVGEAPVISKIEGSKMHLNTDNIRNGASAYIEETDVLKKVDGIVLALPTESEPLQVHPDTAEIKPVKATTALDMKARSSSGDKKITEAAREDKAIENHTVEVDQSGIQALSLHAYDHAVKHFEETGTTQSSNVNEMAVSGEDPSTGKASEGSHLVLESPSASAALVQQDSALRSDASCSSPLRETKQNTKVSNSPENSDSTEIKPEVQKVDDVGRFSSAEIKTDSNKDHTSNEFDEDPGCRSL
ncbi:uncharacterized protein LOC110115531 isoform X2 [Dendrobium catenatum]|uniref:uncharacterized protein LOC110115531 isoform X2 n=1 Tax=Dendrobium catenatum TaxID=906689 RepID=UPI0009F66041|nr:uncharacterized protein LOC110115531 isoform X2 [Dendrobium catenatum]